MVDRGSVREHLEAILVTDAFRRSRHRSELLRYLVEQTLSGQGDKLKGYSIGVDVFGRDKDFNPRADPIVRIEALRLRNALDNYYSGPGADDPVKIVLRKGSYVPSFEASADVAPQRPDPSTSSRKGWIMAIATIAVFFAGVLIGAVWDGHLSLTGETGDSDRHAGRSAAQQVSGPVVVVLPFKDVSQSAETREMASGLTSEIVRVLSYFKEFQVLPLRTGDALANALQAGKNRNGNVIGYTLEGDVSLRNDRLRVIAQLRDNETGVIAWAEKYDRDYSPGTVYSVQEDVAANVVKKLGGPFGLIRNASAIRLANSAPPSLRAYRCVLRSYDYRRSFRRKQHAEVRACLEEAVETDPSYTRAWALLAHIYADEERFKFNVRQSSMDAMTRALTAAKRAVELNPYDVLSYQALSIAYFHGGDVEKSLEAARKAVELNPTNQEARIQLGFRTAFAHDWEAGAAIMREAIARSVDLPASFNFPLAVYHYAAGEYEQARLEVEKAAALDNIFPDVMRAAIYGQLGRKTEAEAWLEKCRQQPRFDELAPEFLRTWQFKEADLDHLLKGLELAGWRNVARKPDQEADN